MWLEAFHLLASLHHAYTTVHLLSVNYAGVTDRYLIVMRDMGLRYLTVWNLVSEIWNLMTQSGKGDVLTLSHGMKLDK
jgi:hypothetical protein